MASYEGAQHTTTLTSTYSSSSEARGDSNEAHDANLIIPHLVEHSTEPLSTSTTTSPRPHRPDLSTFFATLSEITPSPAETRTRQHAVPVPSDVSAAYRTLAEAFDYMRQQEGGSDDDRAGQTEREEREDDLLNQMIQTLVDGADMPPREVEGVSEEFCDGMYK